LEHLRETSASQPDHAYFSNYELEEFLEGPIWHVDGYLFDGNPVVLQTCKYIGTCLDYEFGSPLGSIQVDNPPLAEWAIRCLRALKAQNLTFHLEAIMTSEGPAFLKWPDARGQRSSRPSSARREYICMCSTWRAM
jgi:hypothetical protein